MDLVKPISDTQGLCAQLEENKTVIHISSNNCNEYSAVFFTYSHSENEKKKKQAKGIKNEKFLMDYMINDIRLQWWRS